MSKSKKQKSTVQCPCCKQRVNSTQMKKTEAIFPFDGMMLAGNADMMESFIMILNKYPSFYQWACDKCISQKRAVCGNPKRQFYTFKYPWDTTNPYLAYFDKTFACKSCKESFVFAKEEQQYWYEKLQFIVYSQPKNCKECRKEIRDSKNLNTELSNLLKDGKPDSLTVLLRIAEIYEEMEKPEKMKAYLAEAEKFKRKT